MNIRRFTTFAFVLMIVALIMGLSACDQLQQLLTPTPPEIEGLRGEIPIGVVLPQTGHLGPGEFGPGCLSDGKWF